MALALVSQFPYTMTVDDFLEWDSPGEYLWELIDGVPVAMSPPAPIHGAIQNETGRLIGNHLFELGSPCTVITTPGIIPHIVTDRTVLVPYLGVTCSPTDVIGKIVREPVLLVEILSLSNHEKTWRNVYASLTIPSLREILVIRTLSVGVEIFRRGEDGTWPRQPLPVADGTFTLSSIGLTLPVSALYRGTGMAGPV